MRHAPLHVYTSAYAELIGWPIFRLIGVEIDCEFDIDNQLMQGFAFGFDLEFETY